MTTPSPGELAPRYAWDSPVLDDDGTEPYCTVCGEWAGLFAGLDGWHHFRGDPAPGGQRSLYDAGHQAVIGWRRPPGLPLSPAGRDTLALMLADALAYRAWSEGPCAGCADDREMAASFRALAHVLGLPGESTR